MRALTLSEVLAKPATQKNGRNAVQWAVRNGHLIPPEHCEACGKWCLPANDNRRTIQAHHYKGYEFPLDVEWLCPSCHKMKDTRAEGIENGGTNHTDEFVREVLRRLKSGESQKSLARTLRISEATIWRWKLGTHRRGATQC